LKATVCVQNVYFYVKQYMKGNFCDMFVGMMMVTGQRLSFKGQDKT